MRSIPTFEASPKGYSDLYQTVLIDTPVGECGGGGHHINSPASHRRLQQHSVKADLLNW